MTSAKEKVFSAGHLDAVNAAHPHMVRFLPRVLCSIRGWGFLRWPKLAGRLMWTILIVLAVVCDILDTMHVICILHTLCVDILMHWLCVCVYVKTEWVGVIHSFITFMHIASAPEHCEHIGAMWEKITTQLWLKSSLYRLHEVWGGGVAIRMRAMSIGRLEMGAIQFFVPRKLRKLRDVKTVRIGDPDSWVPLASIGYRP